MASDMAPTDHMNGWMKLFHPKGPQVTLPVPCMGEKGYDYRIAFNAVTAALEAGFLVVAPGLEEGEEKETVGWVLRGAFEGDRGTTPFVLLYADNDALTWSFLKVYLNKPEDVAAFEYASKMTLEKLPDYVGNDKPQRGASQKTDRFIVKAPRTFGVVFKKNPKHDPNTEEGKMKPARIFVRWADQKPTAESNGNGSLSESDPAQEAKKWIAKKLMEDPTMTEINERLIPEIRKLDKPARAAAWTALKEAMAAKNYVVDEKAGKFVHRAEAEAASIGF